MQVSVENTSAIQRRLTIGIPSSRVDSEVEKRLQKSAKTMRLNGFRPGKVPMSVVRKRFGEGLRQEVVGEAMRDSYIEAIKNENLNPAGYPEFEPKQMEAGKDIEFIATIEVYPEFKIADLAEISVIKQETSVTDADIDTMIESLRKQSVHWVEKQDAAALDDRVVLDYRGEIDGEAFEGGEASDSSLELGSKKMIPGFEEGLIGLNSGDEKLLELSFPDDYHAEALSGKAVKFAVTIKKVESPELPEVNEEFFAKYGVSDGGMDAFRAELRKNMEREVKTVIEGKVKQQIIDQLIEANTFDVPAALVKQEVEKIKRDATQRFGLAESDALNLPDELFAGQAQTRVKSGLLFAQLVKDANLEPTTDQVENKVKGLAAGYQDPDEVVKWYMGNPEQKKQIEALVLEDVVIDHILSKASVATESVSYDEAAKPEAPKAPEKDSTVMKTESSADE